MSTWIRELVEFYDFIFMEASNLCGSHFHDQLIAEMQQEGGWADGSNLYERTITKIEELWPTYDEAMRAFKEKK